MENDETIGAINRRNNLLMAYKRLFATEDGVRVLDDMKRSVGLDRTPFIQGKPDLTAFRLGEQNVVLKLEEILKVEIKETKEDEDVQG
jgi:hypothetical protein